MLRSKVLVTFADHHAWPSSLLDDLSIDERDSNGFISRLVMCSSSDNLTDSSQITVGCWFLFCADLACTWHYYQRACNPY